MKDCTHTCKYAAMVAEKYGKTFSPETCDLFKDDGCPDFFEVTIDNARVVAYRKICGDQLEPGDMYIAKRNTGWQLAKCLKVYFEENYVMPDPPLSIYPYDCYECRKVLMIIDEGSVKGE